MAGKQGKVKGFFNENPPTSLSSTSADQDLVRSPQNRKRQRALDAADNHEWLGCINPVQTSSSRMPSSLTLHGHEFVHGQHQSGGNLLKKGSGIINTYNNSK